MYSGRAEVLVAPLFERFTKETGIAVELRYGQSTQELATRLAAEGAQTEADIFFAQDSGYLGALAAAGHLRALSPAIVELTPAEYRDAKGMWVPTSGRARVLAYSPERVKAEDLPKTLDALADPKWKGRIGWAPQNASFQAHVSALRHLWGEEQTRTWLERMKKAEPRVYAKNGLIVQAISSGEIDLGWVNHYYLYKLRSSDPGLKASNASFVAGDAGNLLMLAGAGISAHSKKVEAAEKLLAFLLSEESQKYFAEKDFEYPVRSGMSPPAEVPPLGDALIRVEQAHLADVAPTVAMLRALELF